jgi:hypothetical protein
MNTIYALLHCYTHLLKIKDQIEFTNIAKTFIECLDIALNDLEDTQFVHFFAHSRNKVQAGISTINTTALQTGKLGRNLL